MYLNLLLFLSGMIIPFPDVVRTIGKVVEK